MPQIIHLLETFGIFSGYKLNVGKSECYPVNDLRLQKNALPSQMVKGGFKYLGINITRDMQSLFQANFSPLLEKKLRRIYRNGNCFICP